MMQRFSQEYWPRDYVHVDQVGFMPTRDLVDNIQKVLHIIHYCTARESPTLLLAIDIEKAFDTVESSYFKALLRFMRFGEHFLQAFQAICSAPTALMKVNGIFFEHIALARGVWQGCTLFPVLFALAIEPLATAIHTWSNFTGMIIRRQGVQAEPFHRWCCAVGDKSERVTTGDATGTKQLWAHIRATSKPN